MRVAHPATKSRLRKRPAGFAGAVVESDAGRQAARIDRLAIPMAGFRGEARGVAAEDVDPDERLDVVIPDRRSASSQPATMA